MIIVRMCHVRKADFCSSGAREWCIRNNFDYTKFLREGIAAEVLERTGDALAIRVSAIARSEAITQEDNNG